MHGGGGVIHAVHARGERSRSGAGGGVHVKRIVIKRPVKDDDRKQESRRERSGKKKAQCRIGAKKKCWGEAEGNSEYGN